MECSNYRTVALIPHASKILLHIINARLKNFLLPEIAEEQSWFVLGKGTREQILTVRQIIEKARKFNVTAFLCFVDYTKAFDSVKWLHYGTSSQTWVYLNILFIWLRVYTRITPPQYEYNQMTSSKFRTEAGKRQSCILSPILFYIYSKYIMRKVLEKEEYR